MRYLIAIALLANTISAATAETAPAPVASNADAFSSATTPIGTLLDNPATKAVLEKHLPGLADNAQIEMARSFTLKGIQQFAADQITDEALAKIDADFAVLGQAK